MIASEVHLMENDASLDPRRRRFVQDSLGLACITTSVDPAILTRARALQELRLGPADSLHLSAAEAAGASHFITCDDGLIRRYRGQLSVMNPQTFITWLGSNAENE